MYTGHTKPDEGQCGRCKAITGESPRRLSVETCNGVWR
jgi:hypothetical protein